MEPRLTVDEDVAAVDPFPIGDDILIRPAPDDVAATVYAYVDPVRTPPRIDPVSTLVGTQGVRSAPAVDMVTARSGKDAVSMAPSVHLVNAPS